MFIKQFQTIILNTLPSDAIFGTLFYLCQLMIPNSNDICKISTSLALFTNPNIRCVLIFYNKCDTTLFLSGTSSTLAMINVMNNTYRHNCLY